MFPYGQAPARQRSGDDAVVRDAPLLRQPAWITVQAFVNIGLVPDGGSTFTASA